MKKLSGSLLSLLLIASFGGGCATTTTVDRKIAEAQAETDAKIESMGGQVEDLQERQTATEVRVEEIGRGAEEALRRATEAGLLAKGKIAFQQSFSEDNVRFRVDSYELTKEAMAALDGFANRVKEMEGGIFMEIQGHTDDTGSSEYNDRLGQQRAEAVRRYLSRQHQLPLGRMSTISYGDTLPIESNRTRAGRERNRRVVGVVLE
ncbi:MAG TPA: OmpA family protein [Thermoanaerobaculia bacterium]|nr:OmpA family protein [Thermoanaerobaculia bacterium]